MADFTLESLRGGFDDFSPKSAMPKDACELAENVEFFYSTLGERRAGSEAIDLPVEITGASEVFIWWMFRHTPSGSAAEDELWVFAQIDDVPTFLRLTLGGWSTVTIADPDDEPSLTQSGPFFCPLEMYGYSFHGKLYLAYKSTVDRLHVWDGTQLRRVGLAEPLGPPAVNDQGGGATYPAVLRYYRTTWARLDGSTVLYRSEPSESVAFTPSGAGDAARVTTTGAIGESETHWEVWGSEDDVTFYLLAQVAVATAFYDDTADPATYSENPQADPIGSYTLIPSVRLLSADSDRLIGAGSWEDSENADSQVIWTPIGLDPLPGPDERLDETTNPRIDLDGQTSGPLTNISGISEGMLYAMKRARIYRVQNTGQLVGTYTARGITDAVGALSRTLISAPDESGHPALYFLDPEVGPMRIGIDGMQFVGQDLHNLWSTQAAYSSSVGLGLGFHGVYYKRKKQLHYWIPGTDGNFKIVLQTNEVRSEQSGAGRRGWSIVPAEADLPYAWCSVIFETDIENSDFTLLPFIGSSLGTPSTSIRRCDVGTTDAGTEYIARVRSRAFFLANILNRFGVLAAAVLGSAGSKVLVRLIRDFGTETLESAANMTAAGSEDYVIAQLDDYSGAELYAAQIEFADDPDNLSQWQLLQFVMSPSPEQTG